MNTTIAIILILLVAAVIVYLVMPRSNIVERGFFRDLPNKFDVLLNSKPEITKIIVGIKGQDDFIQFSRHGKVVEMDYPIMTPRQKELSEKYREICSESGITVYETKGSDGSLFLDANVSSEPLELAKISELILRELLGAKDDTKLEFTLLP